MTALAVALAAVLAVVCVVAVALPFLRDPEGRDDRLDEPDELERRRLELVEERDRALAELKELEFDHRTGKISDEDYRAQLGPLRARAGTALRALEPRAGRDTIDPMRAEGPPYPSPFPSPDEGEPIQPPIQP